MKLSTSTSIVAKYVIVCISILLTVMLKTKACGPDFTGWQYTMLLEHYTFNHPFFPYQFDPSSRFYSLSWQSHEDNQQYADASKYNVATWRNYLNLQASIHDSNIKNFIYNNSSTALKSSFSAGNTEIVKSIRSRKNGNDVMQYFLLLNEYKQVMAPSQDVWDYATYTNTIPLATLEPFIKQCTDLIDHSDDVFLQWRFLYLVLRTTHFNKHHAESITLFEKYYPKLNKENSIAQYWCEGVYAGALLRTKQDDKAIYYTARAFANCPDQQMQAMNTYLFSNRNWKSALPYCKTANDSVYVTLLEGANHTLPDMEFIQLIHKTNPNSEVLKLLWLREANKIEEFLMHNKSNGAKNIFYLNGDRPVDMDSMYSSTKTLMQFVSLTERILNNATNIPAKVTVANTAAYYYYKKGDYNKATDCLTKIASVPKDDIEKSQYELLNSLIALKKKQRFDAGQFITLINNFKKIPHGSTNHHVGYYLLHNELAPYFLEQKDTSTAFWIYICANTFDADAFNIYSEDYSPESFNYPNHATWLLNQHYSIDQVAQLKKQYLMRKGNSDFETWLINNTTFADGQKFFNLVIARKHMLAERWYQALQMMDELPPAYTQQTGANPANFYINDYIEEDAKQAAKNIYTIRQILELAQKLKTNADNDVLSSAKDKFLYGTLLYNLSFYGKNHYILDNHWNHSQSKTTYYDYDSIDTHIFLNGEDLYSMPLHNSYQNYFHLNTAEKYLNDALPKLSTDEEKAQCTFLLAKCWQKRCPTLMKYNTEYRYMEDLSDYVGHSKKNPYFKNFASIFKNTKTQEQIFNSCSYYRMYLGK